MMLRKAMMAVTAVAVLSLMSPTDASARGGFGGGGFHGGGFHGGGWGGGGWHGGGGGWRGGGWRGGGWGWGGPALIGAGIGLGIASVGWGPGWGWGDPCVRPRQVWTSWGWRTVPVNVCY
jgi:hypothetical protein